MRGWIPVALGLVLSGALAAPADASNSLRGSRAAMIEQNRVAKAHGLDFYASPQQIQAAVERGDLVRLDGNADYDVADFVSYPYAHPAALLFVERLSAQYHEACGQKLVVTSAVRPSNAQPRNAHALSVHPAGMALDLRVSDRASCRAWLEATILELEGRGVLNGIREFHPPHYHVAIFPGPYLEYATALMAAEAAEAAAAEPVAEPAVAAAPVTVAAVAEPVPSSPRRRLPIAAAALLVIALPLGTRAVLGRRR